MGNVLLLTPTGDRHEAFRLCEFWISRQDDPPPYTWLVVDDGAIPTPTTRGQTVIRRPPHHADPQHTIALNLKAALPIIREFDHIIVIEDDDYYGPRHVRQVYDWLQTADLVGECGAKYYDIRLKAYRRLHTQTHVSLCRTGLNRPVYPTLEHAIDRCIERDTPSVDMKLWENWGGSVYRWKDNIGDAGLSVAIKGMPGRPNLRRKRQMYDPDPDYARLREWIPNPGDADRYIELADRPYQAGVVVYTAIFGGYDHLAQPLAVDPNARYVAFTDTPPADPGVWEIVEVPTPPDPTRANRQYKILPHRWFTDAAWSIYHDGNFVLRVPPNDAIEALTYGHDLAVSLPTPQPWTLRDELHAVRSRGLADPEHARLQVESYVAQGLDLAQRAVRAGLLIRHHTRAIAQFNEVWWKELQTWTHRDQLGFPWAVLQSEISPAHFSAAERAKVFKKMGDHERRDWRKPPP